MKARSVKAFAPASIGNVSCGFDAFGLAVEAPGDEVIASLDDSSEIKIVNIEGGQGRLPYEVNQNTAGVAVREFLKCIKSEQGVDISLIKNLPLGSGMGSSGASAVAAVVAVNHLLDNPLSRKELLPFVMEAERIACGTAHADNVAASLLGGFILVRQNDPIDVISIPVPIDLMITLVHPHIEVNTSEARKVLGTTISLSNAITQWSNTAGLVAGLIQADYDLIGRSLVDVVAEPLRASLIPGFNAIKYTAKEHGALGSGISGSGPTIFALSRGKTIAENVGRAIQREFKDEGLNSDIYISGTNVTGAKIIG